MSFQIGQIPLTGPFVQAALSGYSDWPMRTLARDFGASYTIAEVMLDRFVNEVKGSGKTERYLRVEDGDSPVGAQLMGSDPPSFAPAAKRLVEAGFDVIDINFGCPVKSAIGGCRGGYHLSQPAVALQIVRTVREIVPANIPVTLKMRRGINLSEQSRDAFFEILDGAFDAGVSAITVHGRTVEQKYKGPSDWTFLKSVKEHVGTRTILGSGDLFTAEDCVNMIRETGVNGVTIARGAIGNPWIFENALRIWNGQTPRNPPSTHEQLDVLERHRSLIDYHYGTGQWLKVIRKFGFRYSKLHPQSLELRSRWGTIRSEEDWNRFVADFYAVDQPGQWPLNVDETQQCDPA